MYRVDYSPEVTKQILRLKKSAPQTYKKLVTIISELKEHPYTGTGHPEQLKYLEGVWSRRLDKKNRIRYTVYDDTITVLIVSVVSHYGDK